jgi:hypothetical protein
VGKYSLIKGRFPWERECAHICARVLSRKTIAPIHERIRELVELVLVILAKHSESLRFDARRECKRERTIEIVRQRVLRSTRPTSSCVSVSKINDFRARRSFDHTRVCSSFFFISSGRKENRTWRWIVTEAHLSKDESASKTAKHSFDLPAENDLRSRGCCSVTSQRDFDAVSRMFS